MIYLSSKMLLPVYISFRHTILLSMPTIIRSLSLPFSWKWTSEYVLDISLCLFFYKMIIFLY